MPPASLSAKINADIGDFSRNLDVAGRRWEKFGRDLNQGARSMSGVFGSATGSLSMLSRGFETAGRAAGLFAGLDGLAGIASSLAVGGPVLAGMAALAAGIALIQSRAEEGKKQNEQYRASLDKLFTKPSDAEGLAATTQMLQRQYDALAQAKREQEATFAGTPGAARSVMQFFGLSGMQDFDAQMKTVANNMLAVGQLFGKLDPQNNLDKNARAAKALADETERIARAVESVNRRGMLEAWRLMQPGYSGGGVNQSGLLKSGQALNDALLGAGGGRLNIGDLDPKVREASDNLLSATEDQTSILQAGFSELPNALGSVLGSLLGPLFGSGRGAQIGGALGGAFGGGVGTMLGGMAGKAIGGVLGAGIGSVIPIVGTALGGLLGGAIGGLFGGHKKAADAVVDSLHRFDDALNQTTRTIINGVSGYRYNRAMYGATPQNGGLPPGMGMGGSITVNIANLAVQNARQFLRELGQLQLQTTSRGGASPLQAALVEA